MPQLRGRRRRADDARGRSSQGEADGGWPQAAAQDGVRSPRPRLPAPAPFRSTTAPMRSLRWRGRRASRRRAPSSRRSASASPICRPASRWRRTRGCARTVVRWSTRGPRRARRETRRRPEGDHREGRRDLTADDSPLMKGIQDLKIRFEEKASDDEKEGRSEARPPPPRKPLPSRSRRSSTRSPRARSSLRSPCSTSPSRSASSPSRRHPPGRSARAGRQEGQPIHSRGCSRDRDRRSGPPLGPRRVAEGDRDHHDRRQRDARAGAVADLHPHGQGEGRPLGEDAP